MPDATEMPHQSPPILAVDPKVAVAVVLAEAETLRIQVRAMVGEPTDPGEVFLRDLSPLGRRATRR